MAIGDTIRPELGRTNYGAFLAGSQQGAAAVGRGIAAVGAGVGDMLKQQKEMAKDTKAKETMFGAMAEVYGEDSKMGQMAAQMQMTLADQDSPLKDRYAKGQAGSQIMQMMLHKSATDAASAMQERGMKVSEGGLKVAQDRYGLQEEQLRDTMEDEDAEKRGFMRYMKERGSTPSLPSGGAGSPGFLPSKTGIPDMRGMMKGVTNESEAIGMLKAAEQFGDLDKTAGPDVNYGMGQSDGVEIVASFGSNPEAFKDEVSKTLESYKGNPQAIKGLVEGLASGQKMFPGDQPIMSAKDTHEVATVLRKEFEGLPEVKDFKKISATYQKMERLSTSESAAGDMGMIFSFMKMLDPGSTVREGEYATAQNATNIPGKIMNSYNAALEGVKLNDVQRKDFLDQARKSARSHIDTLQPAIGQYSGLAERVGIDPGDVIAEGMTDIGIPTEETAPAAPATPANPYDTKGTEDLRGLLDFDIE